MVWNCFIFDIKQIPQKQMISDDTISNLTLVNAILFNFYRFCIIFNLILEQYHGYQSVTFMVQLWYQMHAIKIAISVEYDICIGENEIIFLNDVKYGTVNIDIFFESTNNTKLEYFAILLMQTRNIVGVQNYLSLLLIFLLSFRYKKYKQNEITDIVINEIKYDIDLCYEIKLLDEVINIYKDCYGIFFVKLIYVIVKYNLL